MAAHQDPAAFAFQVGAHDSQALSVSDISGTEALNHLFNFRVDFFPVDGEPLEAGDLMGKDALLTVSVRDGTPRHVHGWVRGIESLGLKTGRRRYRAHIVPKLWRLTQMHRSRIFQGQSVPDILKAVLHAEGIEARLSLSGGYAVREYCAQYRESDFSFLSRLMEWEGLFYFFEHTEEAHTLVIGDKPSVHAPLPQGETLPLRPSLATGAVDGEYVSGLAMVHRIRPGAVHLKDFDFEKPALDISGKSKASGGPVALEMYEYPGGYVSPGVGKGLASARLEASRVGSRTLAGQGVASRLTPGFLLELESAGDGTFAGKYLITEVVHSGEQPDVPSGSETLQGLYRNQFRLLPAEVPFRPRRVTPAPNIAGIQTATVVGPAGEEIHPDAHGRVKVQFHWDRDGNRDEKASCWVRVGQPWGGPAWGALYLPRIGQEVVVRFLEGNPDRPLIAGTVYNGTNPTPYALPDDKTKSTLKSASSVGSNGFNELRFEDAAGEEEVFTHAQKDEDLLTENDKDQLVRGYEDLLVQKDRQRTVEENQELRVEMDDVGVVEGNQTLLVQKDRDTRTARSHDEAVEGNQVVTVGKRLDAVIRLGAIESVGAAKAITIGAGYGVNVALAFNEATGGVKTVEIGAAQTELVLGSRQEVIARDKRSKVKGGFQIQVKGNLSLRVGQDMKESVGVNSYLQVEQELALLAQSLEWKADSFKLIVGDKLYLSMEKSGGVKLYAKTLTLDGSELKFKGGKIKKLAAGSVPGMCIPNQSVEDLEEEDPTENKPPRFAYRISV